MQSEVKAMSDIFSRDFASAATRCTERPDIYDAHYDAIAQLKAVNLASARLIRDDTIHVVRHP